MCVVSAILGIVVALVFPAIQRVRSAAEQVSCRNNLRQLGIGLNLYHINNKRLPPGCSLTSNDHRFPYMSWCVRIMPYVERESIWQAAVDAYKSDSNFLSFPPHLSAWEPVPLLICPSDGRESRTTFPRMAFTHYLGVSGKNYLTKDGVLFLDSSVTYSDIEDGLSHTIVLGERPPSEDGTWGWWYAGWGQNRDGSAEMILGVREMNSYGQPQCRSCGTGPFHFEKGGNACDFYHFWSHHPGGAHFLFADNSVRFLRYSADQILPALATRSGREVVAIPE